MVEAWRVLSMAEVVCEGCRMVRFLDGDCAHRYNTGKPLCMNTVQGGNPVVDIDDEDENLPIVDKGKHCADW